MEADSRTGGFRFGRSKNEVNEVLCCVHRHEDGDVSLDDQLVIKRYLSYLVLML